MPCRVVAMPGGGNAIVCGPRQRAPRCKCGSRLGYAQCVAARDVRLDFSEHTVTLDDSVVIGCSDGFDELNAFAIRDGFRPPPRFPVSPWEYMALWWRHTHPEQPIFRGVLIDWDGTFLAMEPASESPHG